MPWGHPDGANKYPRRGYRPPRETEVAGTGGEKSERSIVPQKPGNSPQRTWWRDGKTERGAGNTEP